MINKVILVGRLGKDPEVRHFEGDSSVASFSVATDDGYYDKATKQRVEKTQWVNVVLWNQLSSVAERFLKKGSLVYIEGKLTTRKWQDKDGNDRYTTEVVGRTMKMLSSKGEGGGNNMPTASDGPMASNVVKEPVIAANPAPANDAPAPDDDLPF